MLENCNSKDSSLLFCSLKPLSNAKILDFFCLFDFRFVHRSIRRRPKKKQFKVFSGNGNKSPGFWNNKKLFFMEFARQKNKKNYKANEFDILCVSMTFGDHLIEWFVCFHSRDEQQKVLFCAKEFIFWHDSVKIYYERKLKKFFVEDEDERRHKNRTFLTFFFFIHQIEI